MSTAINGTATEAASKVVATATNVAGNATKVAGKAVAATASIGSGLIGPAAETAGDAVTGAGRAWLAASKTITGLSLDAYDASVKAYLEYTERIAAASNAAWAVEVAQGNSRIVSELAANYTNAARDLLRK